MLYLLCTLLDLSVVELAEHSPRPFGQGMCVCVCTPVVLSDVGCRSGGEAGDCLRLADG